MTSIADPVVPFGSDTDDSDYSNCDAYSDEYDSEGSSVSGTEIDDLLAPQPRLFRSSIWPLVQRFSVCSSVIASTRDLSTYDRSELESYANADKDWLSRVSMGQILRLCVRRNGRVATPWRNFRTFEIDELYCSTGNSWPIVAGVRELIQNWWDGIMQNYNLKPEEITVVEERLKGKKEITTFIAIRKGYSETLGSICFSSGAIPTVQITNIGISLDRQILLLGYTTKRDSDLQLIGMHGEGMKVGILSLLRSGKKVEYVTNDERWEWILYSNEDAERKELAIKFVPLTASAMTDTTVTIYCVTQQDICLENYLFLRPPKPEETYYTNHGCVLLGLQYHHKIFVKGIFVEERAAQRRGLVYGINIQSEEVELGRDRRVLSTNDQTALAIHRIWEGAIYSNPEAASRYLKLLLENEASLDVLDAETLVTDNIARMLLKALQIETSGDSFYYFAEDNDLEEVHIIENVLHRKPHKISKTLHRILTRFTLIRTPEEQQHRVFMGSRPSQLPRESQSSWVRHSLHCLYASLRLLQLEASCIDFVMVDGEIDVDVVREHHVLSGSKFKINDRNLNSAYVHRVSPLCDAFEGTPNVAPGSTDANQVEVCDCAAKRLFRLIVTELEQLHRAKPRYWWDDTQSILLSGMPRNLKIEYQPDESNDKMLGLLSWSVLQTDTALAGFSIVLSCGETPPTQLLLHRKDDPVSRGDDVECESQEHIVLSVDGRQKQAILRLLSPGTPYVASIRQKKHAAFYSVPFSIAPPLHPPANLRASPSARTIDIQWDYNHDIKELTFKVVGYSSMDTQVYEAEAIVLLNHSIDLEIELLTQICSVSVRAVNAKGISSEEVRHSLDGKRRHAHADDSANGIRDKHLSQDDQMRDIVPSGSRSQSAAEGSEDNLICFEDMDSDFERELGDDDEWFDRSVPCYEQTVPRAKSHDTTEVLLDVVIDGTLLHRQRCYDIIGKDGEHMIIFVHAILRSHNGVTLHVTKFFRRAEIPLLIGQSASISTIPPAVDGLSTFSEGLSDYFNERADQESEPLFLSYSNWASRGQESDAEVMPACHIREILTECHVYFQTINRVDGIEVGGLPNYTVKWGFSNEESKFTAYFRRIPEVEDADTVRVLVHSKPKVVDLFCGMGGFSRGFSDAGMFIVAGVDKDWYAGSSFKHHHPSSTLYLEDINDFLADLQEGHIPQRELVRPTVLLIAPPCQGFSTGNSGGRNDEKNNDLANTVPLAVKILKPSFMVFENVTGLVREKNRSHLSKIIRGLMDLDYSIQMKILVASDYGVPQHRQRLFIIASRTGILPPWPDRTHLDNQTTVYDAIGDLQFNYSRRGGILSEYKMTAPDPQSYAGKMREKLSEKHRKSIFNHNFGHTGEPTAETERRLLSWNRPTPTIMATKGSRNACLHPETEKYLTPRECCRCMGITDEVVLFGPPTSQYRQVGNAVCPPVSRVIAEALISFCLSFSSEAIALRDGSKRSLRVLDTATSIDSAQKSKRLRKY